MNLPGAVWKDDLFTQIFHRDLIRKYLDEEQQNKYAYFEGLFFQAFQYAKKKDFENSRLLFEQGETELFSLSGNGAYGSILYESNYPKKAYYYYKTGKFKSSLLLTHKTIIVNEYLKMNFDAGFLAFVQVQQYHNISRILYTLKDVRASLKLSQDLLLLLMLNQRTELKRIRTIVHHDENEMSHLKCGMSYQIIFDILVSVHSMAEGTVKKERLEFLARLTTYIWERYEPNHPNEEVLKDFLNLLAFLNSGNSSAYAEQASHFIQTHTNLFPSTDKVLKLFLKDEHTSLLPDLL